MPVLWDKRTKTIVNNESAEIIRMLNAEFDAVRATRPSTSIPRRCAREIDAVNASIYDDVNNGVYKAGLRHHAGGLRERPSTRCSPRSTSSRSGSRGSATSSATGITEADWRLFTTLVRFDAVYFGHFKCNLRRLVDYPNLWGYTRDLYQVPGVAETVNLDHIKRHYYMSHPTINPTRIVPKGPALDFTSAHQRGVLSGASL